MKDASVITLLRAGLLAGVAWGAIAAPSAAQDAVGLDHGQRATRVDDVIVTARKRAEDSLTVPMSVSAFSGERLERTGAANLRDIGGLAPGVSFNDSNGGAAEFSIRGLTSAGSGSDTSIGLYVDEVFVGDEAATSQRLFDLENIQVLRGPQGTLFGRNTVAGALNVVTRKPDGEFGGSVEATVGDHGLRQIGAALNLPLEEDRLAARITIVSRERDGYLRNAANPGERGNNEDGVSARAHLLARPTDSLTLLASLDGSRDRVCDNMFSLVGGSLFSGQTDPDQSAWDGPCRRSLDVLGGSLRADQALGQLTFTSITAYRERESDFLTDRDFTGLPVLATGLATDESQWTQEFRLASPGGGRTNWVVGGFYFKRNLHQDTVLELGPGFLGAGLTNLVHALADSETESYAAFGSVDHALTPRLRAELGLRYTWETKAIDYVQTATLPIPGFGVVAPFHKETDGGQWSPTLTLTYALDDQSSAYARVARGFKSGGFNTGASSNPAQVQFEPETLWNYEIGYKARLFDSRLRLETSAFYIDYTDIQQSDQDGAGFYISNAASARSYGVEGQAALYLADNALLNASIGYVDARYDSFGAKSGNALPRAPEWTAAVSLDLSRDMGGGSVFLIPEAVYRSGNYVDSANTELFRQPAHTLLNLHLGFESAAGWTITAWGRNLSDERVTLGGFAVAPVLYARTVSPPRTFGVDLRWDY